MDNIENMTQIANVVSDETGDNVQYAGSDVGIGYFTMQKKHDDDGVTAQNANYSLALFAGVNDNTMIRLQRYTKAPDADEKWKTIQFEEMQSVLKALQAHCNKMIARQLEPTKTTSVANM